MDNKYIHTILTISTINLRDRYRSFSQFNLFPTIIANLTDKSYMIIMFHDWVEKKIKNKYSNSIPFLLGSNFYFY